MALEVLALRAAGLGDLLTAVPALRSAASVGAQGVELAAPRWLHPLAPLLPGVSGVVDVEGLAPQTDLSGKVVFNLHGRGPQSHSALLEKAPRDLVAFRCPQVWEFGPAWFTDEPDEPERHRFARLLEWVGVSCDAEDVAIRRPAAPPVVRDAVVLHVGGTDAQRRWPAESFAALARRLGPADVVITGGPGDLVIAQRTAALAGLDTDRVLAGRLALDEFAAVIAGARLVVSGDTGGAHLAHAYGTPSVVVFGPSSPGQWGPPAGAPSLVLRGSGQAPVASDLSIAEVHAAVLQQLEQT